MLILGSLGVFAAVAFVAFALLDQANDRSVVRASLRQLDRYEVVDNVRDQQMLNPFRDRVLNPASGLLVGLARRFTPVGYIDGVRRKLISAGQADPAQLDRFLAVRVALLALLPVMWWLTYRVLGLSGSKGLMVFGLLVAALVVGPDARLNRQVAERQQAIRVKLPDILDLLTISVEAGLGFEQALDRTVAAVPGPMSDEFGRMLGEVRAGASRANALRAVDERVDVAEVRSFILALLQADTFGVSISRILRSQADEARVKRRQLAQEQAQKAPIKMLIPMVFCVFPALFVVVIGPAALNIAENL